MCQIHVHGQFRLHFHRVFSACAARQACDLKHNSFTLLTSKSLCAAATSPSSTSAAAAPTRAPTLRSSWRAGALVCLVAHCSRGDVTFCPGQAGAARAAQLQVFCGVYRGQLRRLHAPVRHNLLIPSKSVTLCACMAASVLWIWSSATY
jgi:hypothetical protein